jgi:hypothetical protein
MVDVAKLREYCLNRCIHEGATKRVCLPLR